MTDKMKAVRQQAPSGSGTTTHTVSGFGTPDAAIVMAHVSGSDSDAANFFVSYGFWDGAANDNQNCLTACYPDASTSSEYGRWNTDTIAYLGLNGEAVRSATLAATTDGVTLTWNDESDFQPYVTVILIKCGDGNAYSELYNIQADGGAGTFTGITDGGSFTPNFIFTIGSYHTATDTADQPRQNIGMGFNADTGSGIDNYSQTFVIRDVAGSASFISDTYGVASILEGGLATVCSIDSMSSGEFTTTDPEGLTPNRQGLFLALACEFDDVPELFTAATPTSSGTWAFGGQSQERQSFLIMTSACDGIDGLDVSGDAASNSGYYFVSSDLDDELGFSACYEDGAATSNCSGRHKDAFMIQGATAGTPIVEFSEPTFTSTGLSVTPDAYDTVARYVVGMGVGEVSVVNTDIEVPTGPLR